MIDIHTHILPGLDDGAQNLEQSLTMARAAVEEGITTVIATPHHANGTYDNAGVDIVVRVRDLNKELISHDIPLTILPGQEVRIHRDLLEGLQDGSVIPLHNTRYLLLELPSGEIPSYTEDMLYELRVLGLTPVIAHPERNREIASDPLKLQRLIELGALTQITTHSLLGAFGGKLQKVSVELCRNHLIHFVSSDAHNLQHRGFKLSAAYDVLASKLGDSLVEYYQTNARSLIEGRGISIEEPAWRKRPFWKFWAG